MPQNAALYGNGLTRFLLHKVCSVLDQPLSRKALEQGGKTCKQLSSSKYIAYPTER